jgi:tetratricopeptide (TPR) repeat protein
MLNDRRKPGPNRRLDSWKEIASYFGRDERTVKRWEKNRGLPVRRLPGARGGVHAFTDELALWMSQREPKETDSDDSAFRDDGPTRPVPPNATLPDATESSASPQAEAAPPLRDSTAIRAKSFWLPAASLILLAAAAILFLNPRHMLAHLGTASAPAPKPKARPDAGRHVPGAEAQELYLQGRYYWNKRTPADLNKALAYFQRAIVIDPEDAQAYVGVADCYNLLREYAMLSEAEAYPKAISAARKAIELDNSLADAHNSLAFGTFYWLYDAPTAEREFRTALSLNPDCSLAHQWFATFLMTIGRNQEAVEQIQLAQKLDSSSRSILADKALILYHAGRTDEGIALLKQLSETEPSFLSPHRYLAEIYFQQQKYPEYFVEAMKAARLSKDEVDLAILEAGLKGFHSGGPQVMLESILRDQMKYYNEGRISAYRLAQTYSLLGREHEAIEYLHIALDRRDSALSCMSIDYRLSKLHDDPSYHDLISQLGLPSVSSQ